MLDAFTIIYYLVIDEVFTFIFIYYILSHMIWAFYLRYQGMSNWYLCFIPFKLHFMKYEISGGESKLPLIYAVSHIVYVFGVPYVPIVQLVLLALMNKEFFSMFITDASPEKCIFVPFFAKYIMVKEVLADAGIGTK